MTDTSVRREDRDGVAVLALEHGKANALDLELLRALRHALEGARDASAVVLTGTGRIFSAGVDLKRLLDEGEGYTRPFLDELTLLLREAFAFPRPLVTAVNGHAIAGGCILALAGDLRLGADGDWRMGVPELAVGVPFPAAALEVVRFQTPPGRMGEVVLRGSTLGPSDAHDLGWIDSLVSAGSLLEAAEERARQLGAIPRASFELTKRMLRDPALERMEHLMLGFEEEVYAAWSASEVRGAVAAYVERVLGGK